MRNVLSNECNIEGSANKHFSWAVDVFEVGPRQGRSARGAMTENAYGFGAHA